MKAIAVDLGRKSVGLALCDELGVAVAPGATIARSGNAALVKAIVAEAESAGAEVIVVGHPLNMDGTAGRSAKDAEKIARLLRSATGIEVKLWDERLSSWEAENLLREAGVPEKKIKERIHAASAAVILRSYLESSR